MTFSSCQGGSHAGDIWEGIYADDCFFGDPTVSFTGQHPQELSILLQQIHTCSDIVMTVTAAYLQMSGNKVAVSR